MTQDQIEKLLWWNPTNPASSGLLSDHTRFRRSADTGDLFAADAYIENNFGIFSSHKTPHNLKRLNFIIDCPRHELHIEEAIVATEKVLKIPAAKYWGGEPGFYGGPVFISLRICGYLVDCWKYEGAFAIPWPIEFVEFGSGHITRIPIPWEQNTFSAETRPTAPPYVMCTFKRYRDWPGRVFFSYHPRYITPYRRDNDALLKEAIKHFRQHPRNFFLDFIR